MRHLLAPTAVGVVLVLSGCDRALGLMPRDKPDGPPSICLGGEHGTTGGLFGVCIDPGVPDGINLPADLSTDACTTVVAQTDAALTEVCVLAAQQVDITRAIRVVGRRPLVIVAIGDLTITNTGSIDVKSRDGLTGAGSNVTTCAAKAGLAGGSGGAGASFASRGGTGGSGGAPTVAGPVAENVIGLGVVRGGCRGGDGGDGQTAAEGGLGGDSGGAVYLIAGGTISVAGTLEASGAPGAPGLSNLISTRGGGGGGGGSGGLIGLDAAMVEITAMAKLSANGGGGGGGAGLAAGTSGGNTDAFGGSFPWVSTGGTSDMYGGDGGVGGQRSSRSGGPGVAGTGGGGGGGGGGVGFIRIYGVMTGPTDKMSPVPNT